MLRSYRKAHLVFAAAVAVCATVITYQIYLTDYEGYELKYAGTGEAVILWWTPFGNDGKLRKCGNTRCYFTSDRSFEDHPDLKSILFYGSNIRIDDLPSWKSDYVPWGLIHEESPRNNPILVHGDALSLFRYSSTFSRNSDVPLTLIDLPSAKVLLDKKYFVPTNRKTELMNEEGLAPLLYIQSDCDTASDRDSYVRELMKYIKVDSYGACLNNAELDQKFKQNYLEGLSSDEFLSFVAKYKFTIAFENAVCQDYITEKLWRPLIVGSVPIYYGSPSFEDWLPDKRLAISTRNFKTPRDLAGFLRNLMKNDSEYEGYLPHKLINGYEIQNERLIRALANRPGESRNEFGSYVEAFECLVCESVQRGDNDDVNKVVTVEHYECPVPVNPLTSKIDEKNWWVKEWRVEKYAAELLAFHLKNNVTIDSSEFFKSKYALYERNDR